MGRLNTPRALVTTSPRSRAAGVRARSTPEVAEWTHESRGARGYIGHQVHDGVGLTVRLRLHSRARHANRADADRAQFRQYVLDGMQSPLLGRIDGSYFDSLQQKVQKHRAKKK